MGEIQKPDIQKIDETYFACYEASDGDLVALRDAIETVVRSGLIDQDVLNTMRFVTFDSKHLYVFTKRLHQSNERFQVEEIRPPSPSGVRTFKIKHSGFIGRKSDDYLSARAELTSVELATTAVGEKVLFHEGTYYLPDVVKIPPKEACEMQNKRIHKGKFDYLTDYVFHEAGHIEQYRLESWRQKERDYWLAVFPNEEKRRKFVSVVETNRIFPPSITKELIDCIDRSSIAEMYTMLIDREAQRRFAPERYVKEEKQWRLGLPLMKHMVEKENIHIRGRTFVRILEERFPNYEERVKFVRSVLSSDN